VAILRGGNSPVNTLPLGMQRLFQLLSKAPPCAKQTQPHGHNGNLQPIGNFLRRILHDVAQQTCLPQIRGQLQDRIR
jgi:hypothetical protein